jgi:hypothetical protein
MMHGSINIRFIDMHAEMHIGVLAKCPLFWQNLSQCKMAPVLNFMNCVKGY